MKTVYFFGAGASRASKFRLPLMSEFFQEVELTRPEYRNLKDLVNALFPGKPSNEVNLEEIVTHLALTLNDLGKKDLFEEIDGIQAQSQLMQYIFQRLSLPDDSSAAVDPLHRRLLELIDSSDSLLTLNYDEILDYALFDLGPKDGAGLKHESILDRSYSLLQDIRLIHGDLPTLLPSEKDVGLYIKLHGSVGWLYCPNPECGNHQQFFPIRIDWGVTKPQKGDPCSRCGSDLEVVIVPPTVSKSFSKFPKLGFLWRLAFNKLVEAEKVVLIGMSIPESDFYLKWLFRETSRKRNNPVALDIVNLSSEAQNKAEQLFSNKGRVEKFAGLEEYVDEMLKRRS